MVGISNKIRNGFASSDYIFWSSLINECCFSYIAVNSKPLRGELRLIAVRYLRFSGGGVQQGKRVCGPSILQVAGATCGDCLLSIFWDLGSSELCMLPGWHLDKLSFPSSAVGFFMLILLFQIV